MSGSTYTYSATSRIPTRPLSYENRSLALPKELIIDYNNATIYICDLNGKIVNITEKMLTQTERIILDTINSDSATEIIKDIIITLDNGTSISIESSIVQLYKQITDTNSDIDNINKSIDEIKKDIPVASNIIPLANDESGVIGTKNKMYALADHVHPKGIASVADVANSVNWSNIKDKPNIATYEDLNNHNHDNVYYKKSGGEISGDVILSNNKSLCGYTTSSAKSILLYMGSDNSIHIGYNNQNPIVLDSKLILDESSYGEELPDTTGAITGQVYFQLI